MIFRSDCELPDRFDVGGLVLRPQQSQSGLLDPGFILRLSSRTINCL